MNILFECASNKLQYNLIFMGSSHEPKMLTVISLQLFSLHMGSELTLVQKPFFGRCSLFISFYFQSKLILLLII